MEIIRFECPQCRQPMGVANEQRGQQVQCPHCYQIVLAPATTDVAAPASTQPHSFDSPAVPATENPIPSSGGTGAGELYGFVPSASAEPKATVPVVETGPSSTGPVPVAPPPDGGFVTDVQDPFTPSPFAGGPGHGVDMASAMPADSFHAPRPRRVEKRSLLVPILLIFLVPYSITITAFFAWHLYQAREANFDPLERLPDPKPGKGGAVRIHPTRSALPAKLKTALHQPLRVGDLEVTPLRVEKDDQGRLSLYLKLRDVSQDVAFNPVLPAEDYQFRRVSMEDTGPYTFLEAGDRRLYMRGMEFEQTPPRKQGILFDGMLQPGEEMVAVFRTQADDKGLLKGATGPLVWRVQLRRGLVAVGDGEVSATALVGVAFDARAIAAHG
jgi:hypothetical protein